MCRLLHGFDRWHFARDSVLEEKVRRRRRMFSWDHISRHRIVMKKYRDAYTKKLSNPKKVPQDVQKDIEVLCYIVLEKYLILEELVLQNKYMYYICHFFGHLSH